MRETPKDAVAPTPDSGESDAHDQPSRSPARYLWAILIARLFEVFPLTCPHCGAEMRLIAFITEAPSMRAILAHIGEPTSPPPTSPARPYATQSRSVRVPARTFHGSGVRCSIAAHPPAWEDAALELDPDHASLAQPEPEFEFDQRVQW